jgi:hypothetical protein
MTTLFRSFAPTRVTLALLVILVSAASLSAFPASSSAAPPIYITPGPIFKYCLFVGGCPVISAHPSSPTASTGAAFSYSYDDHSLYAFLCTVDSGTEYYCGGGNGGNVAALFGQPVPAGSTVALSPALTGLSEGQHKFSVRGVDAVSQCHTYIYPTCFVPGYKAGTTYTASSSFTWVIDHTAPAAVFTSGPADGSTITSPSAEFGFATTGVDLTPVTFSCSTDSGAFSACTTPLNLAGLSAGQHKVSIKPTDAAGNTGAVISRAFTYSPPGVASVNSAAAPVGKHCTKHKKVKVKKHGKVVRAKSGKIKYRKKCVKYSL